MVDVLTPDDLKNWLKNKPKDWAQVIAVRIALRVAPLAMGPNKRDKSTRLPQAVFRATAISWAARNYPAHDMSYAAHAAYAATYAAADGAHAAYAAYAAAFAADAVSDDAAGAADAAAYVAAYANDASDVTPIAAIWQAVSHDLTWLEEATNPKVISRDLANRALWPGNVPKNVTSIFIGIWTEMTQILLARDPSFRVWTDWYARRIRGESAAFDIPGDRYRQEDKAILRKLAEATDEDFWDRGAGYVNATLAEWLAEARERAARNLTVEKPGPSADPAPIPAQSRVALRFGQDTEGKITLAPAANLDQLRTDQDARDRHETVVVDAKALLASCIGRNSAERLTTILRSYIEAAGDSIETMRPSKLVQKGERLRQELARYDDPATDLPPLPDSILNDLRSVSKAHNMVVGLDPVLLELDTAQLPPDEALGEVTKPDMQAFAVAASAAEILAEEAAETLLEAVQLTPDGSDASDRRFRWSAASCKNLVIEAFAVSLNRPGKMAMAVGASTVLGPGMILGNALNTAKFLVERRQWIENKLGRHAPTWKALFSDLCDQWDGMLVTPR